MTELATKAAAPVLKVSGVTKRFGLVTALKNVDLEIRPGEVHALLGENGAGKSTLMSIISGTQAPTEGTISVGNMEKPRLTIADAMESGISIVHQTPALLPDLTVAENLALAIPRTLRPSIFSMDAWVREKLAAVGSNVDPNAKCEDLPIAERQLIEIAKALAIDTKVLILDEPTAPLVQDKVDLLFERIRSVAAAGVAVVYITHRIPEVRELADTMTILRDGEVRGSYDPRQLTDDEIIALIAGRSIEAVFPEKTDPMLLKGAGLEVVSLRGSDFADVSFTVRPGEIVGLAGVAGNGQVDLLRSLAGLGSPVGTVRWDGNDLRLRKPSDAAKAGIAFMPADRANEGVLGEFSIRENSVLGAFGRLARRGVIDRAQENRLSLEMSRALTVKAPTTDTLVGNLSGGNQQKVVLARALLADPKLVLAEEPTQGVDAGARAEIYSQLRDAAAQGLAILVVSSDAVELEGLCDRVLVMSRGSIVEELTGDRVTEHNMMQAMVASTAHRSSSSSAEASKPRSRKLPDWLSRSMPGYVLLGAILVLTLLGTMQSPRFLGEANVSSVLLAATALSFIALGQLLVVLTGGIDLSVGPLTGLVLVILSFFWAEDAGAGLIILGAAVSVAAALAVGALNGGLVRGLNITPVAATLITYIGLQGVSLLLRPRIDGYIAFPILDLINYRIGPIPVAFILALMLAVGLGALLKYSRAGMSVRAAGSAEKIAEKVGVRAGVVVFLAYLGCSLLTFLGGLMLVGQVGVGDPTQGVGYTLSSITAVVVAGTLLRGGSGSPVAVLLGAVLLQVILAMANFMRLDTSWQFWLQGVIVIGAAVLYIQLQRRKTGITAGQ